MQKNKDLRVVVLVNFCSHRFSVIIIKVKVELIFVTQFQLVTCTNYSFLDSHNRQNTVVLSTSLPTIEARVVAR